MIHTLIIVVIACLLTATYLILSRRRRLPHLQVDLDRVEDIESALTEVAGLTGGTVRKGNEAAVYQNGAVLDAMMEAISSARKTIHFETFVWRKGLLEERFVSLLCQQAQQGVTVRVLVDALGGMNASPHQIERLRKSGVQFAWYRPISRVSLRRYNSRTHRKLLILDGEVAFVFGHGIADTWCGNAEDKNHWRDTGVRIQGPLVCDLQVIFVQGWIGAHQKLPLGETCFLENNEEKGSVRGHTVSSSNRGGHSTVALLYLLAIASARREIIIQNPYFAPERAVVELLCEIVSRGVAVHLMLPGKHTDSRFLRRASHRLYGRLLQAGVRLYEFQPSLLHQKIVIVDRVWSHIGSTNFDARSLALNAEISVGLLDKNIALQLREAFEQDLKRSKEVTLNRWQERSWLQRTVDWCAYQVHSQI